MTGAVDFTITNAREIEKMLRELGPKIATRIGDRALRAAAKPIVREAKRLAPRLTGALRKSITAVKPKQSANSATRTVNIGFRPPASRRAHLVEFGTRHNAARPFIRPAMDTKAAEALRVMQETMADGINKEMWKQATAIPDGEILDLE